MQTKNIILAVILACALFLSISLTPLSQTAQGNTWELGEGVELAPSEHDKTTYLVNQTFEVETLEVQIDGILFNGEKFGATPEEGELEIGFNQWTKDNREFTGSASTNSVFEFENLEPDSIYSLYVDGDIEEYLLTDSEGDLTFEWDDWSERTFNLKGVVDLETRGAFEIKHNSAILLGEVTELGIEEIDVYFRYRKYGEENWQSTEKQTLDNPEIFEQEIEDLYEDMYYEYKAVAEWEIDGEFYETKGEVLVFETSYIYRPPPSLSITRPEDSIENLTYEENLTIEGITDPDATIEIDGEQVQVDAETGHFENTVELDEGLNIIEVVARDEYNNTAWEKVYALYMPEIPEIWEEIEYILMTIQGLESEIDNNKESIKELEDLANDLEVNITNLEEELYFQINGLETSLDENVSALDNAIYGNRTDLIDIINENVTKLEGKLDGVTEKVDNITSELESISNTFTDLEDKFAKLQNGLKELEKVYDVELDEHEIRLNELESNLDENITTLQDSLNRLYDLEEDHEELQKGISEVGYNITEIKNNIVDVESDISELKEEYSENGDEETDPLLLRLSIILNLVVLFFLVLILILYFYPKLKKKQELNENDDVEEDSDEGSMDDIEED